MARPSVRPPRSVSLVSHESLLRGLRRSRPSQVVFVHLRAMVGRRVKVVWREMIAGAALGSFVVAFTGPRPNTTIHWCRNSRDFFTVPNGGRIRFVYSTLTASHHLEITGDVDLGERSVRNGQGTLAESRPLLPVTMATSLPTSAIVFMLIPNSSYRHEGQKAALKTERPRLLLCQTIHARLGADATGST